MAFAEKIQLFRRFINIEPLVILFVFIQNNHSLALFYAISDYSFASYYDSTGSIFVTVFGPTLIPITLLLFLGSYSDKYKCRKPFLFLPLYGELISIMILFLCVRNEDMCSIHLLNFTQFIRFIFGGWPLFSMAAIGCLADISYGQTRTLRMGIMEVVMLLPRSTYFDPKDVELWTKINCSLTSLAVLYTIFWIQETQQPQIPSKQSIVDVVNPRHIMETISVLTVKRPNKGRDVIVIFLWIISIYNFYLLTTVIFTGAFNLFDYGKHEHLGKIGVLLMVTTAVAIVLVIFVKRMQLDDMVILACSITCLCIAHIVFGASQKSTALYIAPIIGAVGIFVPGVGESLLTKTVSKKDHGKMSACIAACVSLAVGLNRFIIFHTMIEHEALNISSYSASILYIPFLPAILWLYIVNRRARREEQLENALPDDEDPS